MKRPSQLLLAFCGALVALAPRAAAAEPVRPWQLEIDLGVRGNSDVLIVDGRIFGGVALSPNRKQAAWIPFFAAGVQASYGESSVDDVRGIDGSVHGNRYAIGPEVRFGFAGDSGGMGHYAYLAIAPMYVGSTSPSGNLLEAGGSYGVRSALGFGWPGKWRLLDSSHGSESSGALGIFSVLIVPNHFEFTYENVAWSSNRFGGTIGYSF